MNTLVDILACGVFSPGEEVIATAPAQINRRYGGSDTGRAFSLGEAAVFRCQSITDMIRPGMALACSYGRFGIVDIDGLSIVAIRED